MKLRSNKASTVIGVRVTEAEKSVIAAKCIESGLTMSAFFRRAALDLEIKSLADRQLVIESVNKLRSFGGLLKDLHNKGIGHDEETALILQQINRVLETLS